MPETFVPAAAGRWLPLNQWERQTPEEKFDAAMQDPRLVDEATGFISDADAAALSAMVASMYRESGEFATPYSIQLLGRAYWAAIIKAQRHVSRGFK